MQGNKEKKQKLILAALAAAFPTATFFLFGAIGQYVGNLTEIWFPLTDMLWPSLLAFLLAGGVLTVLGLALSRKEKVFYAYICVLWGIGLALYIQGNFVPNDYGILNGADIQWNDYRQKMVWDALLWVGCIALPFLLWLVLRTKSRAVLLYGACALLGVQVLATGITCLTTDFSQSAVSDAYLSEKGLLEVSEDKNVIIFILDTFDQEYFEQIQDDDPNALSFFDGFTYFSNMSGSYPQTKAAIPYILTNQYYENEQPYAQYIEQAWENGAEFYQVLKDNGFSINIYTELGVAVSSEAKETLIDNVTNSSMRVSSYVGLESAQLQFTAMKFFPDFIKPYVWEYDDLFNGFKSADNCNESEAPFDWTASNFYKDLVEKRLSLVEEKRFSVIHLDGVHPPATMLSDTTQAKEGQVASSITEAYGCLNLVKEYINQLKDLGVYDDSCIIITGDHGNYEMKTRPILLVKGMQEAGELSFSEVPVTHGNLWGTVMSELDLDQEQHFGKSVYAVSLTDRPIRRYLLYVWSKQANSNVNYLPPMVEYNVSPDGNDQANYYLTGRTFTDSGVIENTPYQYKLGDVLYFGDTSTLSLFLDGMNQFAELSKSDNEYSVYADGYSSTACFNVGDVDNDLLAHIKFNSYVLNGKQNIRIKANGSVVYDGDVLSSMQYINFVIPEEYIQDGMLIVRFEYLDAVTPNSLNPENGDTKIRSVAFKEICFSELSELSGINPIDFSSDGNSESSLYSGWHRIEKDKTWTSETASILAVLPGEDRQQMTVTYWTHPGAKDTAVYYNGEFIGTLPHHESFASETIILPEEYRADGDGQTITFVTDGATSSKEYYGGDETDERILGIAVSEISFKPADVVGRTISFEDGEALYYFTAGTEDFLEAGGLWTVDKHCRARFYVAEPEKDLLCRIELHDWMPGGKQRVQITCGSDVLYDGTVSNSMPYINFAVPRDCAADGCIELDFALPDACVPKSLGESEEERELGVRFKAIRFEELEETESIDFTQGGDSRGHVLSGWYAQEPASRWSGKRASVMAILPEGQRQMTVTYWTHPGAEDTEVYYNGERIGVLPHHDDFADETIDLPEEYRADGEVQTVTFVTDGATSSQAYYGGDETDSRILGIAVSAIRFQLTAAAPS